MLSFPSRALTCLNLLATLATAYRPVQFVKHSGDNGRADQGFSLTQHYNTSTSQADLYVRMEAYRYKSTARGWTALALGPMMTGALMFVTYGDPTSSEPMMFTVRTIDGHHSPLVTDSMKDFYQGYVPDVDVEYAAFEEYTGSFFHEKLKMSPSHIGVAEFVVRGYDKWTGCDISNTSTKQPFIWSSNFKQDFQGDFSYDRHIDMHQFGLGFGFLFIDLENALVPEPMYGPLNDQEGHKGVNEIAVPAEPTPEELEVGAAYIESHKAVDTTQPQTTTDSPTSTSATSLPDSTTNPSPTTAADVSLPTTSLNPNPIEQPVHSHKQSSIRSIMWHLHGLLMVAAFMGLYPLGAYLIRSPRPTAFNLHWTIQSLGSILVLLSCIIAYINSHSISLPHQYAGLAIGLSVAAQLLLGYRHHLRFLTARTSTWMSRVHTWLGRALLPLGALNILTGLSLREYGWFTLFLVAAVILAELVALTYYLFVASKRNIKLGASGAVGAKEVMTGADAEEYFQLAGEDDEFSDSDGEAVAPTKMQAKRDESDRLRRLDKV